MEWLFERRIHLYLWLGNEILVGRDPSSKVLQMNI